ncbi:hypothetical protein OG265_27040 [Streptomyces sp. NBC_01208]|uniref:hypothetical protein n=1 Tax=Streptomyces sp. NBC_01208 TaxID=2903773 RepID=UPI002E1365EE|nr:hypothetical protein OG265_27040 [Streptomyces sp. NBC_01208]
MSAYENAVQSLINGGYPDRQAREILSFVCGEAQNEGHHRGAAAARAELTAEFVAWLVKKAREHRAQGPQYAKQANVIGRLADKVQRGAVHPNNLLSLTPQGGPEDIPALRAEVNRLRARVAELEALTPAPIQTCRSCGAGYDYGQPCSVCKFKKRIAAEIAKASTEDPHDSPLHRTYETSHDLPEVGGYRSAPLPAAAALCATCGHNGAAHHHAGTACWADIPKRLGEAIRLCKCSAFVEVAR